MDVFESIANFINDIYLWIAGLPDFFDTFFERIIQWMIVSYFEMQVAIIDFTYYKVAQPVIDSLNLSDEISNAFGGISADTLSLLNYTGLLEGINIILAAMVTRFVLDFIPGSV